MKGILSEHSEQAPIFIKNSFQSTALIWILSLGKKFKLYEFEEKPRCALIKKLQSFFIEGACDRFFIEGFSCFGTKQIYMDGGQIRELALII